MSNTEANTNTNESIILSEIFTYYKSKQTVKIDLYNDVIKLYNSKSNANTFQLVPDLILFMKDVAGSSIGKGHSGNDTKSYLTIYAYVKNTKKDDLKRKRMTIELACSKFPTHDENLLFVVKWHHKLDELLKKKIYTSNEILYNNQADSNLIKPFLVLVNPKAGAGKAKNIYYERVLPVFAESNTPDTLVFTQNANFAREYVKSLKLDDYRGILVVSGDGLMYEVVNGLMERKDWQTAIKTPIGHIPGGSANALSCSVAYLTNEIFRNLSLESFASQTAFNLTKSLPCPLDLVAYELCNKKIIYSFLTLEWAIIADVDLESEKYRFLGGFRFLLGALKRILDLRIYRGRLSFLPAEECKDFTPKTPSIKLIRNNNQEADLNQINTELQQNQEETSHRPQFKYLNPIDKPVPNDWLTIEDNFVLVLVVYLPLISPDFLATPECKFNDGNMHLLFIKEGITKTQLLQLFSETENGQHLNSSFVEYVKIKAFRLEPLPSQTNQNNNEQVGTIMVDGERVPYGIIQGEILPSMGNILANLKD